MVIVYYGIIFIILVFALVYLFWGVATIIGLILARGVPFVPLNAKQLNYLKQNLKLSSESKLVDLGCGDGRVLRFFEKEFQIKDLTGFEVNYWTVLRAKITNKFFRSSSKIYSRNFFQEDLSKYDVVFCYLLESCMERLKDKFEKELKPGTKIVSYSFQIKNWKTPEIIPCNPQSPHRDKIVIYTI